ncbi:MAG: class I SAM-dependent methyltransferase [Opitutaceae bacterium]|nr:class I SAM-dependent methyltransferase [Opitutaceae bacterium]
MSPEQKTQESEYCYPYHYIPSTDTNGFSQVHSWSWGMNYIGGIELVLSRLRNIDFKSLVDVGCGDGRFLREVRRCYPKVSALGVDYSPVAVNLAKAMNPSSNYLCADITRVPLPHKFDVVTMIEVLEHIPPDDISLFLKAVCSTLNNEGRLLLTVPHKNKKLNSKHFQHFTSRMLAAILEEDFIVEAIVPFDRISKFNAGVLRLLGYRGSNFLITSRGINDWLFRRVLKGCLDEQSEKRCGRLLAVAMPK